MTLIRAYISPGNRIDHISILAPIGEQGEYLEQFIGQRIPDMESAGWEVIEGSEEQEEIERNHPPGNDAPAFDLRYKNHRHIILKLE